VTGGRIVSSSASERGGHARPRGLFAPRPRVNPGPNARPGQPGQPGQDPQHQERTASAQAGAAPVQDSAASQRLTGAPGLTGDTPAPDAAPGLAGDTPVPDAAPGLAGDLPVPDAAPGMTGAAPVLDGGIPGQDSAPGQRLTGDTPVLDGAPGQPGTVPSAPLAPSDPAAPSAPRPPGTRAARVAPGRSRPRVRGARHVAPSPSRRPGRTSSPALRRAKRSRIAALAITAIGVLVIGLATGFGSELSAEPTAQAFLFAWQEQQYAAAGGLTTAPRDTVAAELKGAVAELDATQLFLAMKSVVQHGSTADASFMATVNLAQQGRVWTYKGHFRMRRVGGDWKVVWAPSVINPNLGPGERLAVVTRFPPRAAVLDAKGNPLQLPAPAYVLGVWPERLSSPAATAQAFASRTRLQAGQVLGQITAAPPHQFLRLATLDAASYASLRGSLRGVPGLVVRPESQRLFQAEATGLVGRVGSELNERLRADGALYAPGTTVGLSGLEQTYQRQLLGTPSTEVVAVNSGGQQTAVLAQWAGEEGTPVRTTIDSRVQNAALTALDSVPNSGEIVAVRASTGEVLAVGQHQVSGPLPAAGPLNAQLVPGTAFTIVSAAALISRGLSVSTPISCASSFTVGGRAFTSGSTGEQKPFSTYFAQGCGTAFAQLSERLSATQWAQAVKEFGIGADWSRLPVPAFSGSVPAAAGDANLAAQTIGQGNVRMSVLSMAMVAAAVDAGRWHVPEVIQDAQPPVPGAALDPAVTKAVGGLMRGAVRSGAAQPAGLPGQQISGQVALVHTGSGWMSWFVGYRGDVAIAAVESGKTAQLSAAALAGAFFSAAPR
jgi:cell division protein FtsI/penicillin-binding protein 2